MWIKIITTYAILVLTAIFSLTASYVGFSFLSVKDTMLNLLGLSIILILPVLYVPIGLFIKYLWRKNKDD